MRDERAPTEEHTRLSPAEWREALIDWAQQAIRWREFAQLARSADASERQRLSRIRFQVTLDSTLENTPEASTNSPHVSEGALWWEPRVPGAQGRHPGVATLGSARGRAMMIALLVSVCSGLSGHARDAELAREVFAALHALLVVAGGPDCGPKLDAVTDAEFVVVTMQRAPRAGGEPGVTWARELWKRFSEEDGRGCDVRFSRFRRQDRGFLAAWDCAHLDALVRAARARPQPLLVDLGPDRSGVDHETQAAVAAVTGSLTNADITDAARALLRARRDPRLDRVFPLFERLFFERFLYAPTGASQEERPVSLLARDEEADYDTMTSRALEGASFFLSWTLVPGVGELDAGRGIAWHTLLVFAACAAREPTREHPALARALLRVIAFQWPGWTAGFDPDAATPAAIASIVDELRTANVEAITRAALRLAGLGYKRAGTIYRLESTRRRSALQRLDEEPGVSRARVTRAA